ncbi:MAG: RNase adapter RapZ [Candidatus Nanopelagicales bacterium]
MPRTTQGQISGMEVLLVSGMSGAGRTSAARALEDLGWFVIDNLPPKMLAATLDLLAARSDSDRVAVVVDVRGGRLFDELEAAITEVAAHGADLKILFLECSNDVLIRRFESSRRPHPLQAKGRILDGIRRERELLGNLRATADLVVDTSHRTIHDLRRAVDAAFSSGEPVRLRATIMSFGFKYGIPMDADFVADVRFLPNPFWVPDLRDLRGLDAPVNDYVVAQQGAADFLDMYAGIIDLATEGYLREGKRFATIAVGCTGGKHRSVAMAENLGARLVRVGLEVSVVHRDLGRE